MYDTLRERLVTMAHFGGDALFFGPRAGIKDGKLLLNDVSAGFGKEIQARGISMHRCPLRIRLHIGALRDEHEFEKRAGGRG